MHLATHNGNGQADALVSCLLMTDDAVHNVIVQKIPEGLDLNDKQTRHAFKEFVDDYQKALEQSEEGEILHRLESEEVIDAVVRYHRARINMRAAERYMKVAVEKAEIAKLQLIQAINEHEDLDPEEEWYCNIHHLSLLKKTEDKDAENALLNVVSIAQAMANGMANATLEGISTGEFPHEWEPLAKLDGVQAFLRDLADFLIETGAKGQQLVRAIGTDPDIAARVVQGEDWPKPLRALAALVLKSSGENDHNDAPPSGPGGTGGYL